MSNRPCNRVTSKKKAKGKPCKNTACCFKQILEAAPNKKAAVRPPVSHFANYPNKKKQDMQNTAEEERMNSRAMFSFGKRDTPLYFQIKPFKQSKNI